MIIADCLGNLKKTFKLYRTKGLSAVFNAVHEIRFDKRYDVRTRGCKKYEDIVAGDLADGREYEPSNIYSIKKALKLIPEQSKRGAFVDFGCGMGKTLIMASLYGFKKVVGVEYSKELCGVCRENIARFTSRYGSDTEFIVCNEDATSYTIPEEATVFFFFNPFGSDTARKVLNNIYSHAHRVKPKYVFIIFMTLKYPEVFNNHDIIKWKVLGIKGGRESAIFALNYPTPSPPPHPTRERD